jgi:hypothetical protein
MRIRAYLQAYLLPLVGRVGRVRLIQGECLQAEEIGPALRVLGFTDVELP